MPRACDVRRECDPRLAAQPHLLLLFEGVVGEAEQLWGQQHTELRDRLALSFG